MEKTKKVTIIGAGIAGLSAGCYLQMNGYNTDIYEKLLHDRSMGNSRRRVTSSSCRWEKCSSNHL